MGLGRRSSRRCSGKWAQYIVLRRVRQRVVQADAHTVWTFSCGIGRDAGSSNCPAALLFCDAVVPSTAPCLVQVYCPCIPDLYVVRQKGCFVACLWEYSEPHWYVSHRFRYTQISRTEALRPLQGVALALEGPSRVAVSHCVEVLCLSCVVLSPYLHSAFLVILCALVECNGSTPAQFNTIGNSVICTPGENERRHARDQDVPGKTW